MNLDAMAYPDTFIIQGKEHKGRRDIKKSQVSIPCTGEPNLAIGDIITQKAGRGSITLKIIDYSFLAGGTLNIGTRHPDMLDLKIENVTASEHTSKPQSSTIHVGSISGQVQVGNGNVQTNNISVQELIERVAASNDTEAKGMLAKFLNNSTVAAIIGAGAAALLTIS